MEKSWTAEGFSDIGVASIFLDESISRAYAQHRHCYSEELFQIISDYCQENLPELNLAIDVGCGPGNSTVGFTKHFKQVIGVDMSETQLAQAPKSIPNCQFKLGFATNLDFLEPSSVDLVTCGLTINTISKSAFYREVDRVLKPGGTLAVFGYGVPYCANKQMDDIVKWVFDVAMSYCGVTLKECVEKYPDLELPYPEWVKNEDVVIATEGTPEEYMELVNVLYRGMIYFGYKDESLIEMVEKRMAMVREALKRDTGSDAQNYPLFFPTVIYLAHKPVTNKI